MQPDEARSYCFLEHVGAAANLEQVDLAFVTCGAHDGLVHLSRGAAEHRLAARHEQHGTAATTGKTLTRNNYASIYSV